LFFFNKKAIQLSLTVYTTISTNTESTDLFLYALPKKIVTESLLAGPAKSLKSAQYLVEQRVAEEETKRQQLGHQSKGSHLRPLTE
jgi:hypothetical protein